MELVLLQLMCSMGLGINAINLTGVNFRGGLSICECMRYAQAMAHNALGADAIEIEIERAVASFMHIVSSHSILLSSPRLIDSTV